ncbi:MAG: hypothetical protein IIU11_10935, partial [Bacteroidales bacterium]|nr:hypothetical protein [Bacteroidales bacterium]
MKYYDPRADILSYLTQEELLGYDRYWDAISTAKTLASGKYKDGLDAGLKKGREEGEKNGIENGIEQGRADAMREIARTMKQHGDDIDY